MFLFKHINKRIFQMHQMNRRIRHFTATRIPRFATKRISQFSATRISQFAPVAVVIVAAIASLASAPTASAQGFPNITRTPGELLAGPVDPEQGRTAIIAWHGDHIVSIPEPPGSQPGADLRMRVVDISDPRNPQVTILPATTGGFNSHAYFHYGPYLYVGGHCLSGDLSECDGSDDQWRDSFVIGGSGPFIGGSQMMRASMEGDAGLPLGTYNRSGTQSPWGAEMWWSYSSVGGNGWLAVRRSMSEWVHDWNNGGAPTGPAVQATWDHLGETGVIGFPFIIGNILIYASDQTGSGMATYDISDPTNPILLDVLKAENPGGYWPEVYGHYVFFPRRDGEGGIGSEAGFMVVDFEDPTDLRVVADRNITGSNMYVTFQDEFAFMNKYKIDMRTYDVVLELATNDVTLDASQFALPVGNLLVTGGLGALGPGLAIWAHQAAPDTRGPFVLYHIPKADQTNYSTVCPITLSIPETLRTETIVDGVSLIVRPVGGAAVPTWHSFSEGKLLTVTPRSPLLADTTYEVILTSAIQDASGNGLEPYSFRFSTGGGLVGGNQPPSVTFINVAPESVAPGGSIGITWDGSDPDGGPVDFRIDFGDGSPRSAWSTSTSAARSYAAEGHYQITVQARDAAGAISARSRSVTIVTPPAEPGSTASSMLALDSGAGRLYGVNPDNDTVSAIDTSSLAKLWEMPVGAHPMGVAIGADGSLWVACRDEDAIDFLNSGTGAREGRLQLDYGSRPVAIAPTPDGAMMLVSCEGGGTLRRFSVAGRVEADSLALGPFPRAIAITQDGSRAFVTRFISGEHIGEVYDVSLAGSMTLTRTISLVRDRSQDGGASARGVPNYLAGIRISPDGNWAWVVGKKDNTNRGTFFSPLMLPGQDTTTRAQLMLIDVAAGAENVARRLDIDNSDSPSAVAFSPLGDYAFITLQGNAQIAVVDVLEFMQPQSAGTIRTRWGTGLAPQSIVIDGSTARAFTRDFMDRSVTALEIGDFLATGSANVASSSVTVVAAERLKGAVLKGKQIFYHASDRRMSAEGYISCATCHLDGSHDGRTWDFTNRGEGFRNTTDLRGRSGMGHGAVHWSANFNEIQDFENDIRNAFGGTGFLTNADFAATSDTLGLAKAGLNPDLDALAAYVTSLGIASIPKSPGRDAVGGLSAAATRGQAVFASNNCAACHDPSSGFTDRTSHDVGTLRESSGQRLGGPLGGIDTPTLLGVGTTAPYFHNGSARTLAEVFTLPGGRLIQAEDGVMSGGAFGEDVDWIPMKEWHNSMFVLLDGPGTVTFDDVVSSAGGAGLLEIRYNSAYGDALLNINVNGASTAVNMPITPNEPGWMINEWRIVRVAVNLQAGTNNISFSKTLGAELRIDDILFSTPDDAALAAAHVRNLTAGDLGDLTAYLGSLDGSDAPAPDARVTRQGRAIAYGGTDAIERAASAGPISLIYTIENTGPGPLNLGRLRLENITGGLAEIVRQPAPQILPSASSEFEILITPTGASGGTGAGADTGAQAGTEVHGWTDDPATGELRWTISVTEGSAAGSHWLRY